MNNILRAETPTTDVHINVVANDLELALGKLPAKSGVELVRYTSYASEDVNPYLTGLIQKGNNVSSGGEFKAFASKEISEEGFNEFSSSDEGASTVAFRVRTTESASTAKPFVNNLTTTYGDTESEFLYGRNKEFKVDSISVQSIAGNKVTVVQLSEAEAHVDAVDMFNGTPMNPDSLDLNDILSEELGGLSLDEATS